MSGYQMFQMERYGNVLPGSDAQPQENQLQNIEVGGGSEPCEFLIDEIDNNLNQQ